MTGRRIDHDKAMHEAHKRIFELETELIELKKALMEAIHLGNTEINEHKDTKAERDYFRGAFKCMSEHAGMLREALDGLTTVAETLIQERAINGSLAIQGWCKRARNALAGGQSERETPCPVCEGAGFIQPSEESLTAWVCPHCDKKWGSEKESSPRNGGTNA